MKLDTISTRDAFGNALLQIAEENEHVFAIGADTTKSMGMAKICLLYISRYVGDVLHFTVEILFDDIFIHADLWHRKDVHRGQVAPRAAKLYQRRPAAPGQRDGRLVVEVRQHRAAPRAAPGREVAYLSLIHI